MWFVDACRGSNQRTRWWTPAVREDVKLKKEAFRVWLSRWSPEAAERYRMAKRAPALMAAEAKTQHSTTQKGKAGSIPSCA